MGNNEDVSLLFSYTSVLLKYCYFFVSNFSLVCGDIHGNFKTLLTRVEGVLKKTGGFDVRLYTNLVLVFGTLERGGCLSLFVYWNFDIGRHKWNSLTCRQI